MRRHTCANISNSTVLAYWVAEQWVTAHMLIVTHATDPSPELNKDGTGLELGRRFNYLGTGY